MKRITICIPDIIYHMLIERKDERYHSISKEVYFLIVKGLGAIGYDEQLIIKEVSNEQNE